VWNVFSRCYTSDRDRIRRDIAIVRNELLVVNFDIIAAFSRNALELGPPKREGTIREGVERRLAEGKASRRKTAWRQDFDLVAINVWRRVLVYKKHWVRVRDVCPWPCESPRWWPGKVLAVSV
jgi:hypothetical protein